MKKKTKKKSKFLKIREYDKIKTIRVLPSWKRAIKKTAKEFGTSEINVTTIVASIGIEGFHHKETTGKDLTREQLLKRISKSQKVDREGAEWFLSVADSAVKKIGEEGGFEKGFEKDKKKLKEVI